MANGRKAPRLLASLIAAALAAGVVTPATGVAHVASGTRHVMTSGESLSAGNVLTSPNGQYLVVLRADGELVLCDANYDTLWSNNVHDAGGHDDVSLRPDGDLVERTSRGRLAWSTRTSDSSGPRLTLHSDGDLVLRTPTRLLWSTGTAQTSSMPEGVRMAPFVQQLVIITSATASSSHAWLTTWQFTGGRWVRALPTMAARDGRAGWLPRLQRREGDDTTPEGVFTVGAVMYGTEPNPGAQYPYHRLVPGDYWDENPATGARYNTFQHSSDTDCAANPFGGDTECLWREANYYPYLAFIKFNSPPRGPFGSAIFLHATDGATTGCVSIDVADLRRVLTWLTPHDDPEIVLAGPVPLTSL